MAEGHTYTYKEDPSLSFPLTHVYMLHVCAMARVYLNSRSLIKLGPPIGPDEVPNLFSRFGEAHSVGRNLPAPEILQHFVEYESSHRPPSSTDNGEVSRCRVMSLNDEIFLKVT